MSTSLEAAPRATKSARSIHLPADGHNRLVLWAALGGPLECAERRELGAQLPFQSDESNISFGSKGVTYRIAQEAEA